MKRNKSVVLQPLLVNAVEMHRRNPDTFQLPPKELIDVLPVGMDVKICCNNERVWVTIEKRDGDCFVGKLISNPIFGFPEYGDRIAFHADNIMDVWTEDLVEEMKQKGLL